MSDTPQHKHVLFAVSSGVVVSVIRVLTSIAIIPFMLAHLDKDTFGLYVFFISMVDLLLLLDVVSGGVLRLSVELRARRQEEEARQLLSAGHWIVVALSLLFLGVGWLAAPSLLNFINLPATLVTLALLAVKTTLLENTMQFYLSFHQAALRFHHRNYWVNMADLLFSVGNCAAVFLLIGHGFDLRMVFLFRVALALVRFMIILLNSYQVEPASFILRPAIRKATFKQLSFYMTYNALSNGSSLLSSRLDNFIIANVGRLNLVGLNDIIGRLLGPMFIIGSKMTENSAPVFFRLNAEEKHQSICELFLRTSAYLSFLSITFFIGVILFTPMLMHHFSAGQFAMTPVVWTSLVFKAICLWAVIVVIPAYQYLYARNFHRSVVISNLLSSVATFALSLLLAPRLSIAGIALAALIPAALKAYGFLIPRTCSGLKISLAEYTRQVLIALLPALTLYSAILLLFKPLCEFLPWPLVSAAMICLLAFMPSAALWFKQTATPYEWNMLRDLLGKYLPGPPPVAEFSVASIEEKAG